jgi:hypothetical protein
LKFDNSALIAAVNGGQAASLATPATITGINLLLSTAQLEPAIPATAANIKTYTEFAKTQGAAIGMAGSSCAVDSNEFIPVIVAGVAKEAACPPLTAAIKAELSNFNFV